MNTITIPTDSQNVFYVYLLILNSFIGLKDEEQAFKLNALTPKELDVVSEIMKVNDQFKNVDINFRSKYIHSSDVKKLIRENLEMDYTNFVNVLSRVSQKVLSFNGLPIYEKGKLNPVLDKINTDGIQFRFKLEQ